MFDLVAEGGADNVWIVELGDVERSGSFDAFCTAVAAAAVRVDDPAWTATGPHPGFAVRYESPAEGLIESRPDARLVVDGTEVALDHDHRFDNPFTSIPRGETTVPIRDPSGTWILDLRAGTRRPSPEGAA